MVVKKGIVICLKCGARGVKKYIFAAKTVVKCPCGNELRLYPRRDKEKKFKAEVLAWLAESGIVPAKVRVFNTRRYGLEVRCYTDIMEYVSTRNSWRKTGAPEIDEITGNMSTPATYGHHTIRQPMYCHINEDDFKKQNAEEKAFALQVFKDNFATK